jgi:hypothetical protein
VKSTVWSNVNNTHAIIVFMAQEKADKLRNTWEKSYRQLLVVQDVHTIKRYCTRGHEVNFYIVSNILSSFWTHGLCPTDFKVVATDLLASHAVSPVSYVASHHGPREVCALYHGAKDPENVKRYILLGLIIRAKLVNLTW